MDQFRADVAALMTSWQPREYDFVEHDDDFYASLAGEGWLGLQWPKEFGGRGAPPAHTAVFFEEAGFARAPILGVSLGAMVGSALIATAPTQAAEYIPRIVSGEARFCLGYSEPESGSDLLSLRTRATRTPQGWVISGTKVFTSLIEDATHMFLAARVGDATRGPEGVTVFIVPLETTGVSIDTLETLEGKRIGLVHLDDVVVPESALVRGVGEGWTVLQSALAHERVGMVALRLGELRWILERFLLRPEQTRVLSHQEVGELYSRLLAARSLVLAVAAQGAPGPEAAMAKLYVTELYDDVARVANEVAAASGSEESSALASRTMLRGVRFNITGGTSEIQRSVVARQLLRLPDSRRD